jgi:hypothetical protein
MMSEPIVIEEVSRYYDGFLAVDNLSLKVRRNEDDHPENLVWAFTPFFR